MSRPPTAKASSFPGWVALSSLALALWLFFANAAPADRERAELRALGQDLEQLREQFDTQITDARLARGPNAHQDLQALLVAIDRLGLTPAELCAAYPEKVHPTKAPVDEAPGDHGAAPSGGPPPEAPRTPPTTRTKFQ